MNTSRPDIIYFNPDELRADILGCYGNSGIRTPHLDAFAREAVRFEQCHVQNPVCSPSRISYMTGQYVHNRGHRSLWNLLEPEEENTLKYLKEGGYDVHVIGKNDLLSREAAPLSVTEIHHPPGSDEKPVKLSREGEPGYYDFLCRPLESPPQDHYRMQEAVKLLKSRKSGDSPLMLYLPFSLPHCPYTVPEPWYSMYDPETVSLLEPADDEQGVPLYMKKIREYRGLHRLEEGRLKKIKAVYMGMVSYMDDLFGQLVSALKETGRWENTALFVFSDHGDWSGDRGLVEKWPNAFDDCLTRVPMIVKTPGCRPGHTVAEPIECFDIMATTLELTGIKEKEGHFSRTMMPQLAGAAGDPGRMVFSEGGYEEHELVNRECFSGYRDFEGYGQNKCLEDPLHIYYPKARQQLDCPASVCRTVMLRNSRYKYIYRTEDACELYDLSRDPSESRNLYEEEGYRQIREKLNAALMKWLVKTSDTAPYRRDMREWT